MCIGDSVYHPGIDSLPSLPEVYVRAFIEFLQQHPALRDLPGRWVSTNALELRYYPQFLRKFSGGPPFRSIAVALREEGIEKRVRWVSLVRRRKGSRRRKPVVEYEIPRP